MNLHSILLNAVVLDGDGEVVALGREDLGWGENLEDRSSECCPFEIKFLSVFNDT